MQDLPIVPVRADANLHRSAIIAAGLGVLSIVVLSVAGHPLMGVFGCVGLALAALNNWLLQHAMIRYADHPELSKWHFTRGVFGRLGAITLIALGCAVLVWPDGFATFVGLAVFHVIMLIGAAVPVFRSLRPTS